MSPPSWRLTGCCTGGGGAQLQQCTRERTGSGDSAVRNSSLFGLRSPGVLAHPSCLMALSSGHTTAVMRPFASPVCSPGTDLVVEVDINDRLIQQVAAPTASPVRSVQTIARLLLARVFSAAATEDGWGANVNGGLVQEARRVAGVFAVLQRSLQDEGAAQVMRAQLARIRMHRASSAAGKYSRVPALEQLFAAAAAQELQYMASLSADKEPLPDDVGQLFGQRLDLAVRNLESAATQPPHP